MMICQNIQLAYRIDLPCDGDCTMSVHFHAHMLALKLPQLHS